MNTIRLTPEQIAELIGLWWALGTALFTATYFALYLAGMDCAAAVAPALLVAAAGTGAGVVLLHAARRDCPVADRGSRGIIGGSLAIITVQMTATIWLALHSLLRHDDAWTVWASKARMFALGGPPPGYFRSLAWSSHPDYPLNLALTEAAFFRLPDALGLTLASLVGPAFLAALILLCYAGVARLHGRNMGALAAAALLVVPSLPRFAGYGYADLPVGMYGGVAALYLALWWRYRRPVDLVLMGLMAGGAIWTKREGLPIALLLLLGFVVGEALCAPRGRRLLAHTVTAGLAMVAVPLPWLYLLATVRPVGTDFLPMTPAVFVHNVTRLPEIALLLLHELVNIERWSLFWIVLGVLIAVTAPRLARQARILVALLSAQIAVYAVTYVFSDWVPYTLHVDSSLNRLLIQSVPLAVLILVEAAQRVRVPQDTVVRSADVLEVQPAKSTGVAVRFRRPRIPH